MGLAFVYVRLSKFEWKRANNVRNMGTKDAFVLN